MNIASVFSSGNRCPFALADEPRGPSNVTVTEAFKCETGTIACIAENSAGLYRAGMAQKEL
jgi:hypothetical protein